MELTFEPLGKFVRLVDERNTNLVTESVLGINIDKYFMPSVANVIGTDLRKYKLLRNGRFACNPMHVGRDYRLPVARYTEEIPAIVSPAYFMFEIVDEKIIEPEYLMLCFRHPDFDRMCWFKTDASVRGGITWEDFCTIVIPILSIEEQRRIVHDYQVITDRITLLSRIIANIDRNNEVRLYRMLSEANDSKSFEVVRIGDHITITRGVSYVPDEATDEPLKGYIPIFRSNNIVDGTLVYDDLTYVMEKNVKPEQMVRNRSLIIAMSSGSQAHVGKVAMAYDDMNYSYGAFCAMIIIDKNFEGLISTYLKGPWFKSHLEELLLSTTINNIKKEYIEGIELIIPSQGQLNSFENEYQILAAQKANIVKELVALKNVQKMFVANLEKGA